MQTTTVDSRSWELHVERHSGPEGESFLRRLNQLAYEDVVVARFGVWDETKQRAFFNAKWTHQTYSIILACGLPIGAFSSVCSESAFRLLVLPTHQNLEFGTRVVRALLEDARARRVPMLLQVLHKNGPRVLYERLAVRVFEGTETHRKMRWEPTQQV